MRVGFVGRPTRIVFRKKGTGDEKKDYPPLAMVFVVAGAASRK